MRTPDHFAALLERAYGYGATLAEGSNRADVADALRHLKAALGALVVDRPVRASRRDGERRRTDPASLMVGDEWAEPLDWSRYRNPEVRPPLVWRDSRMTPADAYDHGVRCALHHYTMASGNARQRFLPDALGAFSRRWGDDLTAEWKRGRDRIRDYRKKKTPPVPKRRR